MIGKVYSILTPFFDVKTRRKSFKSRPALIISEMRNNDYTVLPVSTISRPENRDMEYDIEIDVAVYPDLHFAKNCFIRTHKQTTIHRAELGREISDLKSNYPDLFDDIMLHLSQYNEEIFNNAVD